MPKNIHNATAPDGTVLKRTSANRVYTHCVATRRSYEEALRRAQDAASRSNFDFYTRRVQGDAGSLYGESAEKARADAIEKLGGEGATWEEYKAREIAKAVARVEAAKAEGEFDRWGFAGWCGRLDLAQKLAASTEGAYYAEVAILPATVVSK